MGETWLIQGPFEIPESGLTLLKEVVEQTKTPPLLSLAPVPPLEANKTAAPLPAAEKSAAGSLSSLAPQLPPSISAREERILAIIGELQGKAPETAERSPRGDIVHY